MILITFARFGALTNLCDFGTFGRFGAWTNLCEFGNFCKVWCLDKPLWFCLLLEGLVIGQAFVILVTFVWFGHW